MDDHELAWEVLEPAANDVLKLEADGWGNRAWLDTAATWHELCGQCQDGQGGDGRVAQEHAQALRARIGELGED